MPRVLIGEHRLKARELGQHAAPAPRRPRETSARRGWGRLRHTRRSAARRGESQAAGACAGGGGRAGGWRTGVGRGSLQTPLRRSSRGRAPDTWQGTMLGLTCAVRERPCFGDRRSCTEEKSSRDFANSEILHVQTRTVFSPRTCAPSGCYRVAQCAASGRMRAARPRSLALPSWLSSRP